MGGSWMRGSWMRGFCMRGSWMGGSWIAGYWIGGSELGRVLSGTEWISGCGSIGRNSEGQIFTENV